MLSAIALAGVRPDWFDDRACIGVPTNVFYPDNRSRPIVALRICDRCPVRRQCLQRALDNGEKYGVFGGMTANQRKNLVARRRWADKKRRGVA